MLGHKLALADKGLANWSHRAGPNKPFNSVLSRASEGRGGTNSWNNIQEEFWKYGVR